MRFFTAGESHGKCLTAIIDGFPAGLKIDFSKINEKLAKRQSGYGRGGRMIIEKDKINFLSGVRFGETTGAPITIEIENRDFKNWQSKMDFLGQKPENIDVTAPRPGHADLSGAIKYNRRDIRDILERSSARETAVKVAVGAICNQFLKEFAIDVSCQVISIGNIKAKEFDQDNEKSQLNCKDKKAEEKMCQLIDEAKKKGDTLGGVFEVRAKNVPIGLGSHTQWDTRLDGIIAQAMIEA